MEQGVRQPRTFKMRRYSPNTCLEKYSFMLVRPPRFTYNEQLLNPRRKHQHRFEHIVHHIPFPLSLYTPAHSRYVVLYLHGNSSSRYEGYSHISHLPTDVALACFDFAGCGNRTEQDYISLGKKEAQEVDKAVRFLRERGLRVVVWGRSMGAVSALLSTESDLLIVDSPFSSIRAVAREVSSKAVPCLCLCFFYCLFPCVFQAISSDFRTKTGVHTDELDVLEKINSNTGRRIIFLAAREDQMVHYSHAQQLYEAYQGSRKQLVLFEGTHHSDRPQAVLQEVFAFIDDGLAADHLSEGRKQSKKQESELADVRSFSLLKEDKGQKQSEQRLSLKIQISSKLVEGGQTEKNEVMGRIDESHGPRSEHSD